MTREVGFSAQSRYVATQGSKGESRLVKCSIRRGKEREMPAKMRQDLADRGRGNGGEAGRLADGSRLPTSWRWSQMAAMALVVSKQSGRGLEKI